jgi:outer membrane protein OmpA-like peptidoglycan-associated protein
MSLARCFLARTLIAPLLAAFAVSGCATLVNPRAPVLRIRTDTVVATVRTARGDTVGTTPLEARLFPREQQALVLTAPGYDSAVVTIGRRARDDLITLINPLSWFIDGATGAAFVHDPAELDITLSPSPVVTPVVTPVTDEPEEEVSDAVMALVLARVADVAEEVGCEPMLVDAWRDAAYVLAHPDSAAQPVPDSVRVMVAEEAERVRPEMQEICARPSPRVDELRQIREAVQDTTVVPDESPLVLAPVYFGPNEWQIRDDSVRTRLRALGARLAEEPVTLVVEGFADGAELRHQELGAQRAMSVIRELQAGGLPADCCTAISHSGGRGETGTTGTNGADAWLNRRVTFTLDYERSP